MSPQKIDPKSRIHDNGEYLEITLSQGKVAYVDYEDRHLVEDHLWQVQQ